MISRTGSLTRCRIDSPAAIRRRISVAERSMRVTGTRTIPDPTSGSSSSPARASTASCAILRISTGARQVGKSRSASIPIRKNSSAPRKRSRSSRSVSTVYDGPSRRSSSSSTSKRGSPPIAARTIRARRSALARTRAILWGGTAEGTKRTRSSPRRAWTSPATMRWPMCGGSKVPPKTPILIHAGFARQARRPRASALCGYSRSRRSRASCASSTYPTCV